MIMAQSSKSYHFVRSGRMRYVGHVDDVGTGNYTWSSNAYGNSNFQLSFTLAFAVPNIYVSTNGSRWYGHSLRCLVR